MSQAVTTAVAAVIQVFANCAQGIFGVYWNDSKLSVYGLFLFIVISLLTSYFILLSVHAIWYRDWSFFWLADTREELRVWGRKDGRISLLQWIFLCSTINFFAAITGWYATPPSRTPPIIQAIFQSVPIITSIPCSKLLLGDRKNYLTIWPLIAIGCLMISIIISLVPSVMDSSGFSGFSGMSTLAWCFVCLFSQIPTGAGFASQQGYLIRSGAGLPGVSHHHRIKSMLRMLFWNQAIILTLAAACFWTDLLPWFGSSNSMVEFSNGISYSFECSLMGPSGVVHSTAGTTATSCSPHTPLYALGFVGAYVMMLLAMTTLNVESAVFNTVCFVVNTMASAIFWLIPGTTPSSTVATPPLWSMIVALIFALIGVIVFKWWEIQQPVEQQFDLMKHALPDRHAVHDTQVVPDNEEDLYTTLLSIGNNTIQ